MDKSQMPEGCVFAMDIGTRSIIGMVGTMEADKLCVTAIEKEEHGARAMVDGQIEDIELVARVAASVKRKLEDKLGFPLNKVYVAAAGRSLRTQHTTFELELPEVAAVTEETLRMLETGALARAEEDFEGKDRIDGAERYYLVGYTVKQYYLDKYPLINLLAHKGRLLAADIIATFLPSEVVESLYSAMQKAGMDVAGMTLEPIASMNAAIPKSLRLLNLVLVDIGAGTSDIASARDGSICGYTMATIAGDEVTECLMREYLVDFETAEMLKIHMFQEEGLEYTDVLGFVHTISPKDVAKIADSTVKSLCKQIAERIIEVNGGAPSAVFLVGGGSKLAGVRESVAEHLGMDAARVALGGNNFSIHAFSNDYDIKDPEYSTPLGIAVSAGLNLIHDSFYISLNGQHAKLFRNGKLTVRDILMMNGYGYKDIISRSGENLKIEVDGQRIVVRGEYAVPAQLKLNGQSAGISDVVSAGDEIIFEPARNGADAAAHLSEVAEKYELTMPLLVNGEPADPEQSLKDGDIISRKQIEVSKKSEETEKAADIKARERDIQPAPTEEADRLKPKVKTEIRGTIHIFLNNEDMLLQKKENGLPYYLMDMLVLTGMNFSEPEGEVALRVNGENAGFQRELRDGDKVDIYWS